MEIFNHLIYKATEEDVKKVMQPCNGCDFYGDKGIAHNCRYYYQLANGSDQAYCSKKE